MLDTTATSPATPNEDPGAVSTSPLQVAKWVGSESLGVKCVIRRTPRGLCLRVGWELVKANGRMGERAQVRKGGVHFGFLSYASSWKVRYHCALSLCNYGIGRFIISVASFGIFCGNDEGVGHVGPDVARRNCGAHQENRLRCVGDGGSRGSRITRQTHADE